MAATIAVTTVAGALFGMVRVASGSVVAPVLAPTATNSIASVAAIVAIDVTD